MATRDTVIITSVISAVNKALSYSPMRSLYSADERASQTLQTIASLRKHFPQATLVLVESGLSSDLPHAIDKLVDEFMYIGGLPWVRLACDSKYKGFGEAVSLLTTSWRLPKSERYFKISGRYELNDHFDVARWAVPGFLFKQYGRSFSTRFYKFDGRDIWAWRLALARSLPALLRNRAIEEVLPRRLRGHLVHEVATVGIQGLIGPNGTVVIE